MLKDKKLIIFDLDGTLIDSAPSLAYSINLMLKELNKKPLPAELIKGFVGNGADILIKRALSGKKEYKELIDKECFKRAKDAFFSFYSKNLTTNTTLYPNVLETLNALKDKNYTLALATNKPIEFVADILSHFKLDNFFKLALGGGSTQFKKPHPQMLLKISQDLNIKPNCCVMVGDSSNDIIASKKANMSSIALTYGYNQGINLKDLEPDVICNNFKEILDFT